MKKFVDLPQLQDKSQGLKEILGALFAYREKDFFVETILVNQANNTQ